MPGRSSYRFARGREDLLSEAQLLGKAHQFAQSMGIAPEGQQFAAIESERCLLRLTLLLQAGFVSYRNPQANDGTVLLAGQYPALLAFHP